MKKIFTNGESVAVAHTVQEAFERTPRLIRGFLEDWGEVETVMVSFSVDLSMLVANRWLPSTFVAHRDGDDYWITVYVKDMAVACPVGYLGEQK